MWVIQASTNKPLELQIPSAPRVEILTWESPRSVLLQARKVYGEAGAYPSGLVTLVRCHADTGACERVAESPTGHAVLP